MLLDDEPPVLCQEVCKSLDWNGEVVEFRKPRVCLDNAVAGLQDAKSNQPYVTQRQICLQHSASLSARKRDAAAPLHLTASHTTVRRLVTLT